jgi:cytochrome c-type biogenesis protein CcmF
MTTLGQFCLLIALVGSGYAAFACIVGWRGGHGAVLKGGLVAAWATLGGLSGAAAILARALMAKDFRFDYVARYSDALLPAHYSLSAFWVGQAGSLLLWAWFVVVAAITYRLTAGTLRGTVPFSSTTADQRDRRPSPMVPGAPSLPARCQRKSGQSPAGGLRELAFGVLMAYAFFLVAIMAFAADPMQPSLPPRTAGDGLSPLLQHPAMLVHPPVVFLGYALWSVPFALALACLISGRFEPTWLRQARAWSLLAWAVLGGGILWGAQWAYEELGWGGYWNWDPVENGSLMPWLAGTALIHGLLRWQHSGGLKKTTLGLAIATFALCNFAAFLTRSGIFSSLHAFSQSPIGWMFLGLILLLAAGGAALLLARRDRLAADRPLAGIGGREALVDLGVLVLMLLVATTLAGTLVVPLASILRGPPIVLGAGFYNGVLIPTGLLLLGAVAVMPLGRWRASPTAAGKRWLAAAASGGVATAATAFLLGLRHPVALAVAGLAAWAVIATAAAWLLDARRLAESGPLSLRERVRVRAIDEKQPGGLRSGTARPYPLPLSRRERGALRLLVVLRVRRRQYAALGIHLAFVMLAIGVTGSALGSRSRDATMRQGDVVHWAGYSIRCLGIQEHDLPDRSVLAADLQVSEGEAMPYPLAPTRAWHRAANLWTTGVAILSRWDGDLYAILRGEVEPGRVDLTFQQNPMMRWLWGSGWVAAACAGIGLWPPRRRRRGPLDVCYCLPLDANVSGTLHLPPANGTRSVPDQFVSEPRA